MRRLFFENNFGKEEYFFVYFLNMSISGFFVLVFEKVVLRWGTSVQQYFLRFKQSFQLIIKKTVFQLVA